MVRLLLTLHWTLSLLISSSAQQLQSNQTELEDGGRFDGHGFMVNVLVGKRKYTVRLVLGGNFRNHLDYLRIDCDARHLYQQYLHQALPQGSAVGDESFSVQTE